MLPTRPSMAVVAMGAIAVLAGCAGPADEKRALPDDTACVPAAQAESVQAAIRELTHGQAEMLVGDAAFRPLAS